MMDTHPTGTWYVARRFAVPADLAAPALDRIAGAELVLRGDWGGLVAAAAPPGLARSRAAPRRVLRGRLHLPHRRAAGVEVELTPWSTRESELGVRPTSLPRAGRGKAYTETAVAALDRLHDALLAALMARHFERDARLERAS
jgi:hypothetical protein